MKKGKISNLFDYLYLTIATTLSVLFYIHGLSRHFSAYEEKTFFMKVCLKEKYRNDHETWRIVAQVFSFTILIGASIWILYGASWFHILANSKNRKVPSKFGRYQRNIYTFSDTIFISSFGILCDIIFYLVMNFLRNYDKDKVQTVGLLLFLFFDLILSFILPLLLIRKLLKTIPELFRNSIAIAPSKFVFYVRQPEFSPREDVVRISNSPVCKYAVTIHPV